MTVAEYKKMRARRRRIKRTVIRMIKSAVKVALQFFGLVAFIVVPAIICETLSTRAFVIILVILITLFSVAVKIDEIDFDHYGRDYEINEKH